MAYVKLSLLFVNSFKTYLHVGLAVYHHDIRDKLIAQSPPGNYSKLCDKSWSL